LEKRVVITGLGAVTPVGIGKENFYNALLAGQSGIGPITRFDASDYATRIAGEVKDFDITKFVDITNVGLSDKVENLCKSEILTARTPGVD